MILLLATPALRAAPAPLSSAPRVIPIQFCEGLLWVEVNVPQSSKPLSFLLDTGASASVLNLSTARRFGLDLGRKVRVKGVGTTLAGYWPVTLSAKARQVELPSDFLALDLGKLSGACHRSVDGLIGADFFRDKVVEIDYEAAQLRLLEVAPCEAAADAVPLEVRACGMRVSVNVNGDRSQWVRVDTGCATAFQWVTSTEQAERCTGKPAVGLAELSIPQTVTKFLLVTGAAVALSSQAGAGEPILSPRAAQLRHELRTVPGTDCSPSLVSGIYLGAAAKSRAAQLKTVPGRGGSVNWVSGTYPGAASKNPFPRAPFQVAPLK